MIYVTFLRAKEKKEKGLGGQSADVSLHIITIPADFSLKIKKSFKWFPPESILLSSLKSVKEKIKELKKWSCT